MDNQCSRSLRAARRALARQSRVCFNLTKFTASLHECFRASGLEVYHGGRVGVLPEDTLEASYQYLIDKYVSKYASGDNDESLREAAFVRFYESEASCQLTNQRFASLQSGLYGPYTREINRARNLIWDLLGPTVDMEVIARGFGFGPGASTRLTRSKGDVSYKFSGNPESTILNRNYAEAAIRSIPLWHLNIDAVRPTTITFVPGNRLTTVPKNDKTDRMIAIEPCMNMFIQKGFGAFIRSRLKRVQIDLNDQSNNQNAALAAYTEGYSTIDLSMASDTVSYGLVKCMLPPDWFEHLNNVRSQSYVLESDGEEKSFTYQKFSSMGNGFTFELESLIFWALCQAVTELHGAEGYRVFVYGDDLVVKRELAPLVIDLLSFCGFATNEDKSFISGNFFESCGKHFHKGHDITPFFIRKPIVELEDLFLLHNNLYRYVNRIWHLLSIESLVGFSRLLATLRRTVGSSIRKLVIPDGFGDGGFVRDSSFLLRYNVPHELEGSLYIHLVRKPLIRIHHLHGLLIKGLYRIGNKELEDSSIYPTSEGKLKVATLHLASPPYQYGFESYLMDHFGKCPRSDV